MKLKDLYENYQLKKSDDYRKSSDDNKILDLGFCQIVKIPKVEIEYEFDFDLIEEDFLSIESFVSEINDFIIKDIDLNILEVKNNINYEDYISLASYVNENRMINILNYNYDGYTDWQILTVEDAIDIHQSKNVNISDKINEYFYDNRKYISNINYLSSKMGVVYYNIYRGKVTYCAYAYANSYTFDNESSTLKIDYLIRYT